MITVDRLSKTFWIHRKEPGLWGSVKSLVRRRREPKRAVREISFKVDEGEIVGLIGSNGAGKTTLVKMLAGIVHPSSGDARVLGHRPWQRSDALRRQIALIMGQKAQLWWDLPAADCFLLLREIYRIPEDAYRRRLAELSELLDVGRELDVQVRRLSLGERMKMELIAALLHAPRCVFLDEPTIGLDLAAQRAVRDFVLDYRRRHQPVMLVTSHYMDDIERLCERILVLRQGELVYDGSRRAVVERFARSKVLTVHLRSAPSAESLARLERVGRRLEDAGEDGDGDSRQGLSGQGLSGQGLPGQGLSQGPLRLEVSRERVAEAAAAVMELLEVADLSIEDEPLGQVVERIQRASARELGS